MLAFAAVALGATASVAAVAPSGRNCFLARDWDGWKSPAPDVVLIRVGANRIYRLDLQHGSDQLKYSDARLLNRNTASPWLCDPLDFRLVLTDRLGVNYEPLIVTSVRQLTPEEIDAIPPTDRP